MSLEEIISAVLERPPIWNSKNINHKNRRIINQLWEEIKNELNVDVNDLKKKWKNLRDQFRKELRKVPAPRSGDAGNHYEPTWQHFRQMSFMRDEMLPENSDGNLELNHNEDSSSFIDNDMLSSPSNDNDFIDIEESSTTTQQTPNTTGNQRGTSNRNQSRKRKTANDIRTEFLELEKRRITLLEKDINQNQNNTHEHEKKSDDYYFLMSLLPQMESFSPVQKFRVRQKFNQAIMEELNFSVYNECNVYGYQTQ